jgi:uncharacterized protein (TIGR02266 family)
MADELFRNANRRSEDRIPARVEIHFPNTKDAARAFKAYSLNFSPGGICVRMREPHALGDRLMVKMLVEGQDFEVEAVVAWTRGTIAGMRFDGLSAEDRLRLEKVAEALRARPPPESSEVEVEL